MKTNINKNENQLYCKNNNLIDHEFQQKDVQDSSAKFLTCA